MVLTELERKAIGFAVEGHKNHIDKAGKSYIAHPLRVAMSVLEHGEDVFCTALLHDLVEDTDTTLDTIEATFNKKIRDAVDSVSRRIDKTTGVKEKYFDFVERSGQNQIGILVKIADLEDNMSAERLSALPVKEQTIVERYRKAHKILMGKIALDISEGRFYENRNKRSLYR